MATNMRFSELTTASSLADSDIFALAKLDGSSESGYMSYKATLTAIAIYLNKLAVYSSDLDTNDKHIIGAINELKRLISLIPQFNIVKVQVLPTEDISDTTIYLVPSSDPQTQNVYDEFIHIDNAWEQVGSTAIDLSDYYTKAQIDDFLDTKANTADVTASLALKENKADMQNDVKEIIESCYEEKTVTGNPITVKAFSGSNAKALTVSMNPIQDLHGQSAPYPAGGGKNKLPLIENNQTSNGITIVTNKDNDGNIIGYTLNGTATGTTQFGITSTFTIPAGTYILNGCNDSVGVNSRIQNSGKQITQYGTQTQTTTTLESDLTDYFRIRVEEGATLTNAKYYPMLRLSTVTDATFAPYSNICPISGRTEVNVQCNGVNQWDEEWESGMYSVVDGEKSANVNNIRCKNPIPCLPNTSYYYKCTTNSGILYYDKSGNYLSYTTGKNKVITTPANCYYITFYVTSGYGTTYNNDISINYPSTDTDYHKTAGGETHTHQYSDTIYGGVDDFVNGGATSTMGMVDLGDLTWTYYTAGDNPIFYASISDTKIYERYESIESVKCSNYKNSGTANQRTALTSLLANGDFSFISGTANVVIRDDNYTSAEDFKTAMSGVQLCYELATPTTISTSAEEIALLKGQNVLSTDADDMELSYQELPDITSLAQYVQTLEARIKALEEAE